MNSRDFFTRRGVPGPFDPTMLDRSVIAIPLLNAIEAEVAQIERAQERWPDISERFTGAMFYNPEFPGGVGAARKEADRLVREAISKASRSSAREIVEAPAEDAAGEYSFTAITGPVVRKLLALNADLPVRPILRILPSRFDVIIDANLDLPDGRQAAKDWIRENIEAAKKNVRVSDEEQHIHERKTELSNQYVFARLEGRVIKELVRLDAKNAEAKLKGSKATRRRSDAEAARQKVRGKQVVEADTHTNANRYRAIYRIWPDFAISACITKSLSTVKADAAQSSFSAHGRDIAWAVMDSGIDVLHPHFALHGNIDPASPLHEDFTDTQDVPKGKSGALVDRFGHGTHVAGIIAGEQKADGTKATANRMRAVVRSIRGYEEGALPSVETQEIPLDSIRGMAPRSRLVSLKVLDDDGHGEVSNLIAALAHIQEKNGHGRRFLIHGVNISLGYDFDPEWFACGQSPLCVEINRLVRSGVVVVVSAGNTGYGAVAAQQRTTNAGMGVTINDPGNADLAITVGSTHRDMPHVYGVSYFSSKGPTGDGRLKPDVVAPGEKILSCATGQTLAEKAQGKKCEYVEDSGTSMAAPHVSGVIAAFLSVRREFIGEPEKVKAIFLCSATDLKRDRYFQGAGLIDLMRAIQSV
ncbi:MAG: S8 family peptidase [Chthoniobacterales bacterium]|nr:S8 family peptidase [Chthoniobacterales bacterium]